MSAIDVILSRFERARLRAALSVFALAAVPFFSATAADDAVFTEVVRQAQRAAAAPFRPNDGTLPEALRALNAAAVSADPKAPPNHDSDGLLIGHEQWRPLNAVEKVTTQIFPEGKAPLFLFSSAIATPRTSAIARRATSVAQGCGWSRWVIGALAPSDCPGCVCRVSRRTLDDLQENC